MKLQIDVPLVRASDFQNKWIELAAGWDNTPGQAVVLVIIRIFIY